MNIERALTIDGFMTLDELTYIAEVANRSVCIVEIGTYKGRSARAWSDNTFGALFCVDTWRDGGEAEWNQNLADCQNIVKVKMDSRQAAMIFTAAGIKFDAVFIDADHDYDNVRADINTWICRLRKGGIIMGHDYQPAFPGVMQAVQELIPNFRVVGGSIWTSEGAQ